MEKHWKDLPMNDRYKFAYDKVWEETSEEMKPLITGEDTRPAVERGDCKSYEEEFVHDVALFAEEESWPLVYDGNEIKLIETAEEENPKEHKLEWN
jgi:hypothetical protein